MHKCGVFRWGFFLVIWVGLFLSSAARAAVTLESSFNVTQIFTDNLFFDDTNTKSDFGTLFGPNFLLQFDHPDIVLGAEYLGRVAVLYENPDESRYVQNANIILDLPFLTKRFKKLTVTIDENMSFTPQLDAFSRSGAQDASTFSGRGGSGGSEDAGFSQGVGGKR